MVYTEYLEYQKQLKVAEESPKILETEINGFPLWFLLKDTIYFYLFYRFGTSTVNVIKNRKKLISFIIKCFLSEIKYYVSRKNINLSYNKKKLLFILNYNFGYLDGNKTWKDPFWSEVIKKSNHDYQTFIIEYNQGERSLKEKDYKVNYNEYFIKNPLYNINYYINQKRRNSINNKLIDLINFFEYTHLNGILDKKLFDLIFNLLSSKYIRLKINSFLNEYKKAVELLSKLKPEIVFLTSPQGHHGIIAAAKELKIKVIEYQHGIIDSNHPAYNYLKSFKRIKSKGALVPDYLFLFGAYWKNLLLKDGYWDDEQLFVTGYSRNVIRDLNKSTKYYDNNEFKILYTALAAFNKEAVSYFEQFLNYISKNKSKIFLTIKLHPREPEAVKYYEHLTIMYPDYCEIISDNRINIYDLFSTIDYHLTSYSTSLYESLSMGIPSATIHQLGLYYFHDLIAEGVIKALLIPQKLYDYMSEISISQEKYDELKNNTAKYKNVFYGEYNSDKINNIINELVNK